MLGGAGRYSPARVLAELHDNWFGPARIKDYGLITVTVYVLVTFAWVAGTENFIDGAGTPIGHDFIAFWSASLVALTADPVAAYDPARIMAAQRLVSPAMTAMLPWSYPPTFLLAVLPLALMPYLASFILFIGVTFCAYSMVVYWIAPSALTLMALILSPGALMTTFHGQNGFLTGALLGAACYYVDRRPIRAGIAIGLLAYKPHWGLLFPIALVVGRRWNTFAAAAATVLAFAAASTAVLGPDAWVVFAKNLSFMQAAVENGNLPWLKMPTTFVTLRLLGAGPTFAYAAQLATALAAAAAVAWIWSKPVPIELKGATVVLATTLTTPYLYDYDLAALAIPLALLAREATVRGLLSGERVLLVLGWTAPLLGSTLAVRTGVQVVPAIVIALIVLTIRRAIWHLDGGGFRPAGLAAPDRTAGSNA